VIAAFHDGALGQLEFEQGGMQARVGENAAQRIEETRVLELQRGDVHRHGERPVEP
jgi:hypothetical protein